MCPRLIFPSHSPSFKVSRSVSWGAGEGFSDLPYHPHMLSVLEISPVPREPERWGSIQCFKSPHQQKGQACPVLLDCPAGVVLQAALTSCLTSQLPLGHVMGGQLLGKALGELDG